MMPMDLGPIAFGIIIEVISVNAIRPTVLKRVYIYLLNGFSTFGTISFFLLRELTKIDNKFLIIKMKKSEIISRNKYQNFQEISK